MIPEFYGLGQDAFSLSPDLDFLYLSTPHKEAVAHLVYGLEQNEDIILLCGDIGTGKTLALHRLADQVSNTFDTVVITVTTLDFDEFLRLILLKLGVDVSGLTGTATLIFSLENRLIEIRNQGRKVLLVVDECQNLEPKALESVRLIMNLGQPGGQVLQLVLAGQLGLRENLNLPELRQLRQRIRVDYQLEYMTRDEIAGYIEHRLQVAGRIEPLFRSDALDQIHRLSKGVPRVVNYLASKALLAGYVDDSQIIKAQHIENFAPGAPTEDVPLTASLPVERLEVVEQPVKSSQSTSSHSPSPPPPPAPPAPPQHAPVPPEAPRYRERKQSRSGQSWWLFVVVILALGTALFLTQDMWRPRLASVLDQSVENPQKVVESDFSAVPTTSSETREQSSEQDLEQSNPAAQVAVTVEAEPENIAAPAPEFAIHVASFREANRADSFGAKLGRMGYNTSVLEVANSRNETWNRVYVRNFATRDTALETATALRSVGTISYYNILNVSDLPE